MVYPWNRSQGGRKDLVSMHLSRMLRVRSGKFEEGNCIPPDWNGYREVKYVYLSNSDGQVKSVAKMRLETADKSSWWMGSICCLTPPSPKVDYRRCIRRSHCFPDLPAVTHLATPNQSGQSSNFADTVVPYFEGLRNHLTSGCYHPCGSPGSATCNIKIVHR